MLVNGNHGNFYYINNATFRDILSLVCGYFVCKPRYIDFR